MAIKIGSEDKKKVIIAGALALVVVVMLVRFLISFFGGSSNPETVPAPVVRQSTPSPAQTARTAQPEHAATKVPGISANLDPTLHPEWMAQAESLEYSGQGRNIFSQFSAPPVIEKVKAPIRPSAPVVPIAQGPPPPPPIDLKFFGYEARKDGTRRAFLLHGDDVFIASEGDVVDHRYRVMKINPFSVEIEDLPYHNAQPLQLVQN
jgi:hypothetical protein